MRKDASSIIAHGRKLTVREHKVGVGKNIRIPVRLGGQIRFSNNKAKVRTNKEFAEFGESERAFQIIVIL